MINRDVVIKFIKKQNVAFITSIDEDGFPNIKAISGKRQGEHLFLQQGLGSL